MATRSSMLTCLSPPFLQMTDLCTHQASTDPCKKKKCLASLIHYIHRCSWFSGRTEVVASLVATTIRPKAVRRPRPPPHLPAPAP